MVEGLKVMPKFCFKCDLYLSAKCTQPFHTVLPSLDLISCALAFNLSLTAIVSGLIAFAHTLRID